MLSRDGEADRYPRRGPDDPGAPFFDGTMEHVVSSTPTYATRRNPGILGPYYPDATRGSNVGAPGKPSLAASGSCDDENGPEGVLRERRAARRASGRLAGRIRAPRAGDRGVGLPLRRRDRAKTTDQERRRSVRNRSLHVDVARRVYRRARASFARLYRVQKRGTRPRRSSPDERGPTDVDRRRSRRCPRHRTTTRRGPGGVN